MIIAIDIGNTRIKWGVHDGVDWLDSGALATENWPSFADVVRTLPLTAQVILSSVT